MQIYVGNLAYSTTEQEVRQVFEIYGVVHRVQIPQDRETGRPRGFGLSRCRTPQRRTRRLRTSMARCSEDGR